MTAMLLWNAIKNLKCYAERKAIFLAKNSLLLAAMLTTGTVSAQLTGIKTIPGDYATITLAVTALNTSGVGAGGVTFHIAAGATYNETIPIISATGTATDSIVFKRNGAGANPVIVPVTVGTLSLATSTTGLGQNGDAIVTINGGDYIVFDGIDLQTNASFLTNATRMEYGYMLKKASATNACKNVTIRNCTITLNKLVVNSFGIFVSNFIGTAAATPTSTGGRTENVKIFNNTITNAFGGIQLRGYAHTSSPYNYLDQNIQVGEDGGNTINNFGNGTIAMYGIYSIYQNNLVVANNIINNLANGGAANTGILYGIFATTAANATATFHHNNITLGHAGTTNELYALYSATGASGTSNLISIHDNNISGCTSTTFSSGDFYGIYQSATPYAVQIYNNTVSNNVFTISSGTVYGIYNSGSVVNQTAIYNNTVSGNTKSGTGVLYNVYNSSAATCTSNIYNNSVFNNNSGNGTHYGIYMATSLLLNVYKNNIYGLTTSGASGEVYGIHLASGPVTTNIYNNLISELTAPIASSTTDAIRGISLASATVNSSINLSHNSIFLNAGSTGTTFSASGVYYTTNGIATSATLTMRNNNIVNNSTPSGAGIVAAFKKSAATLYSYDRNSGNNNFYAGTPSATKLIHYDGTNADQTLAAYTVRVSPADGGSVTEMPPFVNITTAPYNLHITPGVATQLESGGLPVTSPLPIADDYDGNPRGALPDMGADEFTGIVSDLTGPSFSFTPAGIACATTDRAIAATISDLTGVPTTGTLRPAIYFRKNAGTWYSQPGTLSTGSANNGTWTFSVPSATMGGLIFGDVVSYYIIAQDAVATPNIASVPAGAVATDVNNVTSPPSALYSYRIGTPMAGTYTINAANSTAATNFQDFGTAAASLGCGITGPVTINVAPASGPYNEQIVVPEVPGASITNTITLNGNNNTISYLAANPNERAIIRLDGSDFMSINGLTITATGTTTTEYGYGVQMMNDADNNTINNCIININTTATSAANYCGIVVNPFTAPSGVTATGDTKCDNNIISNNTITGGYFGIVLVANGSVNTMSNNIVTGNTIKEFYSYGIYTNGNIGMQIRNNDISRLTRTSATNTYGVMLATYAANCLVDANRVHNLFTAMSTNTSNYYGVYVNTDAPIGSPNTISNNAFYKLDGEGLHYNFYLIGNNTRIYHNSISSDETSSAGSSATYGMYIQADNIDIKNNIFSITRGGTGSNYGIYFNSGTGFTAGKNLYYVNGGGTNFVGYHSNADQATLTQWQTASGQDATSPAPVNPAFASSATGNLAPTNLTLDNLGTPVGVLTDILNIARSVTAPDMGAFEFGVYPLDVNILSFTAKGEGRDVLARWDVADEHNLRMYILERSGDGKSFVNAGMVNAAGLTGYTFNDKEAVDHAINNMLYYRLRTVEHNGNIALSKVVAINLNVMDDIFSVYPNPFSESIRITATTTATGVCTIRINDIAGRTVLLRSAALKAGTNHVEINGLDKLAQGNYKIVADIDGRIQTTMLVK